MHCPRDSFESIVLDLGDCIGVESCVDLKTKVDMGGESPCCGVEKSHHHGGNGRSGSSDQRLEKMEKQFPPPIPWLARTENLPSHMPWIMKRYYTDDGRLVIRGEKVKRHEYFQADRSNGRLTLRLIPINDDGDNSGYVDNEVGSGRMDGFDGEIGDQTVVEEEPRISKHEAESCKGNVEVVVGSVVGGGGGGGGGKFYKYYNMSRSSCMFGGIAVAAVRSVHT